LSAQPKPLELDIGATADQINAWLADPVDFARDCFAVEPDAWQANILRLFPHNRRLAMQACVGPGKTCVLAWLILNFMLIENAEIAALSVSGANVRNNLWKELAYWRGKCAWIKAAFAMTATRLFVPTTPEHDYERTWFCELRTWSKDADENLAGQTLQGLHAANLMVVMDESGSMPDALMIAAEGILATIPPGGRAHIVQAGNPTVLSGPLWRAASKDRSMWKLIQVTGDPDDPERSPRINLDWAREMIKAYGRNHPWVMVKIFGQFPPSSFRALIGPDEMRSACGRHLSANQYDRAAKIIGVDVARYGDDATVIWPRQGLAAFEPIEMRNAHPDDVAGQIMTLMEEWAADSVMVDATGGFGDGVVDSLGRIGITAIRVQFAGKPIEPKFYNKRAEIIWNLVEWVRRGGAIAPGAWADLLTEELTTIEYTFRLDKIMVEEKDMIKIRLGRSPDYSDALACSFAFPVMPRERDVLAGSLAGSSFDHAVTDYDVLERQ
jgi:phage terminase large subunit